MSEESPVIVSDPIDRFWGELAWETFVQLLPKYGADREPKSADGRAALDLAKILKWDPVNAGLQV